jgi:hypothetical protein
MKVIAFMFLIVTGCTDTYEAYLWSLPTRERVHNDEAVAVVADFYGISATDIRVAWVADTVIAGPEDAQILDGVGILDNAPVCDIWVHWSRSGHTTLDAVEVNTDFWTTALAHEISHCALKRLTGNSDGDHKDHAWWGWCDDANQLGKEPKRSACTKSGWHPGFVNGAQEALWDAGLR